jgi:enoyl-CoA hydratase/carnithine racemase
VDDLIVHRVEDGVAVISLNRPDKHNALNDELAEAFRGAIDAAIDDPEVRSLLLRGEGRSFSSGRDTTQLGRRPGGISDEDFIRQAQQGRLRLLDCPKPVVAALNGYVLGGAFETALAADMRVAADTTQLGFPEIQYGLVPDTGGTQLLTLLAGPAKAKYLIISGARIDAATALAWGIVDWVVPADELDGRAMEVARQLAAATPSAATAAKLLVDRLWRERVGEGIDAELTEQIALFAERRKAAEDDRR